MSSAAVRRWRPPQAIRNPWLRWAVVLASIAYLYLAFSTLDVNWERVQQGIVRAQTLFSGFLTPDFTSRGCAIITGMLVCMSITVVSFVRDVIYLAQFAF